MSRMTGVFTVGGGLDHFEPQETTDPRQQMKLKAALEAIDYTAFASNKEVLARILKDTDRGKFQRLAVAAAEARAHWIERALALTETAHDPRPEETEDLARLRHNFEELTAAYEAMRRMVERGYLRIGA